MLDDVIQILKEKNEFNTAEILLDTFAKYSSSIVEYDILGKGYFDIKKYKKSIHWTEKSFELATTEDEKYAIRANLAKLYNHDNEPYKALDLLKINEELTPADISIQLERSFSLFLINEKEEGEQILREAVNNPTISETTLNRINFNLGTYDLYNGNFQKGLYGFLIEGKKIGIWKNVILPFPFWNGGVIPGKTIVILGEGGIGDELINVRFYNHLKDYGMNPIWFTSRKDLKIIFERHKIKTISSIDEIPANSVWTYSMALPIYLNVTEKDLWHGQYLFPNSTYVSKYTWINRDKKLKIGIRWAGNPEYDQDLHRSLPIDDLYNTIKEFDCTMYSLQRDHNVDDIKDYTDIHNLENLMTTYEDTLAIIDNLDIIVTSCTSVAHAAAAMNKRVFVLVPITAYYIWANPTEHNTYWYGDNVTVIRQTNHKCWQKPLTILKKMLATYINTLYTI